MSVQAQTIKHSHIVIESICACVCVAGAKDTPSIMESLTQECLKNPFTWLFAISYFFVYIVRTGVTAWFIHFLIKVPSCFHF
jgi:sugar phosphate permease